MKHQYLPCFLLLLLLLTGQAALAQAPTITVLSPTRNGRNAPATTYVSITFDQPISCGTITLGAVRVFSQQRGSTSASGNTLTFDPATNFQPGETILTTVTSSAQRSGGGSGPGAGASVYGGHVRYRPGQLHPTRHQLQSRLRQGSH